MRTILHCLLLSCLVIACGHARDKEAAAVPNPVMTATSVASIPDSFFLYHFKILDSAAQLPPKDSCYHCCYSSIQFMEQYTGIEAEVDEDYFGPKGFKKEDLRKWHDWFDREYRNKRH